MSAPEATNVITTLSVATPPQHPSVIRAEIAKLGHFLKTKGEELLAFVAQVAPVVETVAAAVAPAVAAPVEAVINAVEKVACTCAHADIFPHNQIGCIAPGCTCKATNC